MRNFADKEGKVWQGGGGRNPPPDAPHLVVTTPDIESLRPKSPMKNQQQQSYPPSLASSANSANRRATGNSPQANPNVVVLHQEASTGSSDLCSLHSFVMNLPLAFDRNLVSPSMLFPVALFPFPVRPTRTRVLSDFQPTSTLTSDESNAIVMLIMDSDGSCQELLEMTKERRKETRT